MELDRCSGRDDCRDFLLHRRDIKATVVELQA